MSMPIQFAFQGGGARLALLLPVVTAIRGCEEAKLIKVTQVAGTSAGAIAASLVAGKADMNRLVEYLRDVARNSPDELREVFPSLANIGKYRKLCFLARIFFLNHPIASEETFAQFLKNCFRKSGISENVTVGDLIDTKCIVICADIVEKRHVNVSPNATLIQTLVDSAALPFVFRITGEKFDGGLIDNLPIDHLTRNSETEGQILAVSFDEEAYAKQAEGPLSLAASLLDATLTSRTRSTIRTLGRASVLSLSPDAGDDIVVDSLDAEGFIKGAVAEVVGI
jgi:predicted acylesterase/phospholipase RssA